MHSAYAAALLIFFLSNQHLMHAATEASFMTSSSVKVAPESWQSIRTYSIDDCMAQCVKDNGCHGGIHKDNNCYLVKQIRQGGAAWFEERFTSFIKISEQEKDCKKNFYGVLQDRAANQTKNDLKKWMF
ncbi:hypothetical protein L596_012668 [Steinernema carpocapsae]|uniref:Apple domain-containing protein n=1 Tax=Steinernema carpocapsae TaxID=34508 RepID=A0A4V6A4V7_STECR|nr:hypothetical protein L596_012668 [Steinernema carpocapsae]